MHVKHAPSVTFWHLSNIYLQSIMNISAKINIALISVDYDCYFFCMFFMIASSYVFHVYVLLFILLFVSLLFSLLLSLLHVRLLRAFY